MLPNNWLLTLQLVVDGTRRLILDPPYINTDRAMYTKLVQNNISDPGVRQSKMPQVPYVASNQDHFPGKTYLGMCIAA